MSGWLSHWSSGEDHHLAFVEAEILLDFVENKFFGNTPEWWKRASVDLCVCSLRRFWFGPVSNFSFDSCGLSAKSSDFLFHFFPESWNSGEYGSKIKGKKYGLQTWRNLTRLPWSALGSAKKILYPILAPMTKSVTWAATWLSGSNESILPLPIF